jgi:peptidoglycan/xylan/chitin deacetylase (PgdA/CDA1 family)
MYHSISDDREDGSHPYYHINTTPKIFAEHMKYLHDQHYTVITLDQVVERIKSNDCDAGRFAAITFDDGFRDFNEQAFPILQQFGFPSTVFLPAGLIGGQRQKFKGKELLTWDEARALRKAGVVFGSHSMTHRQMTLITREEVWLEVLESRDLLENELGDKIDIFSYPFAFPQDDKKFGRYLIDVLLESGYRYGVSTRIGTTSNQDISMFMKRIPINSGDDLALFQAKLSGAYNWLYMLQMLTKLLKIRRLSGGE